jgi:hypothetical protein
MMIVILVIENEDHHHDHQSVVVGTRDTRIVEKEIEQPGFH